MAHNPLLGNRISLISKKNIRYEGTLYSINEADATVALADVRSYGTEGREKIDPNAAYVPPQDAVHPYLLFRGCDIKDLHVHERRPDDSISQPPPLPPDPAILSTQAPSEIQPNHTKQHAQPSPSQEGVKRQTPTTGLETRSNEVGEKQPSSENKTNRADNKSKEVETDAEKERSRSSNSDDKVQQNGHQQNHDVRQKHESKQSETSRQNGSYKNQPRSNSNNRAGYNRRPRRNDTKIGTGASLLNRKARGAVEGGGPEPTPGDDFDFETSLAEFNKKTTIESDDEDNDDSNLNSNAYSKDDFFDSISCDAIDKQSGIDNRLRGAAERSLNMDTFGAVSLGNGRRGGRRRGRRGPGGGRGNPRGGRGRGDGGPPPRENQRWKRGGGTPNRNSTSSFSSRAQAHTARAGGER